MIVLTNCLTQTADEGALKVANSLIKRIREQCSGVKIVSYERQTQCSDMHFTVNKLMFNPKFLRYMRHADEEVIYIPFPAGMLPTSLRIFILSMFVKRRLKVVLTMQGPINRAAKCLLRLSRAETFSLSRESWQTCKSIIGEKANHLKAGVDTGKFTPVSAQQKAELKRKYNIPEDSVVVLHVGHMQEGRNLRQLLKLDEKYFILIATSTFTAHEQDKALRKSLEDRGRTKIIDTYLPNIEEIYQLSDVYFFPVVSTRNCIDAPLSAFEAASCNIPVVHTPFGALTDFRGEEGFYEIQSFEPDHLNQLISAAIAEKKKPRNSILNYDWKRAIENLCK